MFLTSPMRVRTSHDPIGIPCSRVQVSRARKYTAYYSSSPVSHPLKKIILQSSYTS